MSTLESYLTTIADAIREKKGTTEPINASNFASEILSIQGGGSLNVAYGTTPPSDKTKIWLQCAEPSGVEVKDKLSYNDTLKLSLYDDTQTLAVNPFYSAIAMKDNYIYIVGGLNKTASNEIYRYNIDNKKIELFLTLEKKLQNHCATIWREFLCIFGGVDENGTSNTTWYRVDLTNGTIYGTPNMTHFNEGTALTIKDEIYLITQTTIYKITALTLDVVNSMSTPTSMLSNQAVSDRERYIYIASIYDNGIKGNVYKIDTQTMTYTTLRRLPIPTYSSGLAYFNNKLYIFGGVDHTGNSSTVRILDVENNSFIEATEFNSIFKASGRMFYCQNENECYVGNIKNIYKLSYGNPLNQNNAIITTNTINTDNALPLINTEKLKLNSNIASAYLGNANNLAEKVNAYYWNGSTWKGINCEDYVESSGTGGGLGGGGDATTDPEIPVDKPVEI